MPSITKALNETTNLQGGFLVPEEWTNKLLALVTTNTIFVSDMDSRQMATDVQYIPKVTSGTTAYWVAETSAITESQPSYGQITLTAKKVAALSYASSEVLEDNNVDLANHLVNDMARDIGIAIDSAIYAGTGSPWYGLRTTNSFTNAVDGTGNVGATGADGTGSSITGAVIAIATIMKANLEVLKDNHSTPDTSYWAPRTYGAIQQLTDSTTRPILNVETYGSPLLREGIISTLLGTRVRVANILPTNYSYGTTAALSGNCSDNLVGIAGQYAILGNRRNFIWKSDYFITGDYYAWQTTARMAFAVKYPNAYCMIRGITN